jgi:two-component system sensor histidine kinase BaeS
LVQIAEDATRMAQIESDRMVLDLGDHEVGALIERGTRAAQAEARGRSLTITVEAASDLPPARVDPERLTQAVANLVRNGIRFTPDGGRVDVRAWREPGRDRDQLLIEVRDSGIGIPEDRMSVLFNRTVLVRDSLNHHSSSRLEFNSAGLGLGLPIARGIVEAHGGTIEATSRPGEGTRFLVRIPYGSGEALRRAG